MRRRLAVRKSLFLRSLGPPEARSGIDGRTEYVQIHIVDSRDIIAALKADGWYEVGQKGSHVQFKHPTKPGLVTVATHGNRDLKVRDIASIERQSGIKLRR